MSGPSFPTPPATTSDSRTNTSSRAREFPDGNLVLRAAVVGLLITPGPTNTPLAALGSQRGVKASLELIPAWTCWLKAPPCGDNPRP
ncbi:hypothetical protein C1H69_07960 [Billgrantia endophytica]|uniref:Uncharacterized protein n=1 Tax=Billgrantia endophytica TaxID=2033802 RepID=A0A2N7U625_9GAMM|nr:hypothetical protein C1H69_07960 [Halomonas endophytica]